MPSQIKIGYWKIRGLAQPIRYLLKYAGQDFENIMYEQGDPPDYSRESWFTVKHTLGLAFPNLPYLIDGDIRITQSNAILNYLASKFGLCGETDKVKAENFMMVENAMDFRNGLAKVLYNRDYSKLIDDYFTTVHTTLKAFDTFLEGRTWFAGGKNPTACDFPLYELLDQHRLMKPDILKDYKNLQAFLKRFEELPQIKAYLQSGEFFTHPVNNKTAGWK
ncbi:unnamed protein product [Candidula unifasciata]|uniref:glutathione transferase n=1 Tax=Candidula unifasciata TaxID=100452 RepID=A0A8S3ZMG5_9EUPU|nr:unnamed protein product [Candidula unifasciata]